MAKQLTFAHNATKIPYDSGMTMWNKSSELFTWNNGKLQKLNEPSSKVAIATSSGAYSYTASTWSTAPLDTESYDPDAIIALASNQATLGAGRWWIHAFVTSHTTATVRLRLYNATDAVDALGYEGVQQSPKRTQIIEIFGEVVLTASKAIEVQVMSSAAQSGSGGLVQTTVVFERLGDVNTVGTESVDIAGLAINPQTLNNVIPSGNDLILYNNQGVPFVKSATVTYPLVKNEFGIVGNYGDTTAFSTKASAKIQTLIKPASFMTLNPINYQITLIPGKYEVYLVQYNKDNPTNQTFLYDLTNATNLKSGLRMKVDSNNESARGILHSCFEITQDTVFELQIYSSTSTPQCNDTSVYGNQTYFRRIG